MSFTFEYRKVTQDLLFALMVCLPSLTASATPEVTGAVAADASSEIIKNLFICEIRPAYRRRIFAASGTGARSTVRTRSAVEVQNERPVMQW